MTCKSFNEDEGMHIQIFERVSSKTNAFVDVEVLANPSLLSEYFVAVNTEIRSSHNDLQYFVIDFPGFFVQSVLTLGYPLGGKLGWKLYQHASSRGGSFIPRARSIKLKPSRSNSICI